MKLKAFGLFASLIVVQLAAVSSASAAGKYVYLDDVSGLKYQMGNDGTVYFRNLNEFDGSVTGYVSESNPPASGNPATIDQAGN